MELQVQGPFERLRAAAADHDQLLQRITRRQQVLAQLHDDLRDSASRMAGRIGPLVDESDGLDLEIHELFQALLADRARSRAERARLQRLYRDLQGDVISMAPTAERRAGAARRAHGVEDRFDERGGEGADEGADDRVAAPSATRPGDRTALRGLFRRLAELLHPDKVLDGDEKARRTEVMKQITVAYQRGDLARLIEIERTWTSAPEAAGDDAGDDVDRRLALALRANTELRAQLRQIERELRMLRATPEGTLAKALKRRRGGDPLDAMADEIAHELVSLRQVRDHVRAFHDGRISLAELLRGPRPDDEDEQLIDLAEAVDLLVALVREQGFDPDPPPAPARRKQAARGPTRPRAGRATP